MPPKKCSRINQLHIWCISCISLTHNISSVEIFFRGLSGLSEWRSTMISFFTVTHHTHIITTSPTSFMMTNKLQHIYDDGKICYVGSLGFVKATHKSIMSVNLVLLYYIYMILENADAQLLSTLLKCNRVSSCKYVSIHDIITSSLWFLVWCTVGRFQGILKRWFLHSIIHFKLCMSCDQSLNGCKHLKMWSPSAKTYPDLTISF